MIRHLRHIIRINLIIGLFATLNAAIDIQMARKAAENIITERSNNYNFIKDVFIDKENGIWDNGLNRWLEQCLNDGEIHYDYIFYSCCHGTTPYSFL